MPDIDFQLKLSNVNWSRPYQWKVQLHTTADDLTTIATDLFDIDKIEIE